jgi:hypothetical protein
LPPALRYDIEWPEPQANLQTNPSPAMGNNRVTSLTTLEMLDAVEAGISGLRSQPKAGESAGPATAETAAMLRAELRAAGASAAEFAQAARVAQRDVDAWIAGVSPVPPWVLAAIRLMAQLAPPTRYKPLNGQANAQARPANRHPFARIEEL